MTIKHLDNRRLYRLKVKEYNKIYEHIKTSMKQATLEVLEERERSIGTAPKIISVKDKTSY